MAGEPLSCPACGRAIRVPQIEIEQPSSDRVSIPAPRSVPTPHSRERVDVPTRPAKVARPLAEPHPEIPLPSEAPRTEPERKKAVSVAHGTAPPRKPNIKLRQPGKRVLSSSATEESPRKTTNGGDAFGQRTQDTGDDTATGRKPKSSRRRIIAVGLPVAVLSLGLLWYARHALWMKPPVFGKPGHVAGLSMDLVWVVGGSFEMGSSDGDGDEQPVRTVEITYGYWIGRTEVTNRDYQRFLRASAYVGLPDADSDYLKHVNGSSQMPKGRHHPVVWVSWKNAVAFCAWLNARERQAGRLPEDYLYRLPTEAEWELAARGGSNQSGYLYSGAEYLKDAAWYRDNSRGSTQPVGTKRENGLGLYDMSGNVWEWCQDWYQNTYTGLSATDPMGPGKGQHRVLRGGGWNGASPLCRSACRGRMMPSITTSFVGFRVALAPAGKAP